jgi:predicted nucleotidyltransferase
MDKKAVLEIIQDFKNTLETTGVRVERIILFGSYADGIPHEWSDIDLVVISPDFINVGLWERIKMISKAISIVFQPIQAIPMTPEEWERGDSMIAMIAREGEEIK